MASISQIRVWNDSAINLTFDKEKEEAVSSLMRVLAWLFLIGFPFLVFFAIKQSENDHETRYLIDLPMIEP